MFIDKFLNFINQDDKDIFNFFTSLENRLYLTYYFEDIFDRNYIINFNDSNYFNKLLDIENDKLIYLIIIKGVANENDRVKYILDFNKKFTFNDYYLFKLYKTLNNDANKISILRLFTVKKFNSHALVHLANKNIIKENISYLTQEDFLLFVGSLPDEDKISYINKNILVTDIIAMLSLENIELYFNQITKIQKKIVIHKIANEEIKLYMLNKYSYLFSQDELDYLLENIIINQCKMIYWFFYIFKYLFSLVFILFVFS